MIKIMTILGTRPEIIRLSATLKCLDASPEISHVLVHTGQNYDAELNEVFFADLGLRLPDHVLDVSRESLGRTLGDILAQSEQVMLSEAPDAVLILGDTNSSIAAVMAKRMHIPVFHMEAGNRSFDQNVPEETNRRIVDHTADFNLVYTEHARHNLLREGIEPRRIYLTGSPMNEVLTDHAAAIADSTATSRLGLTRKQFFLVSAHREENVDNADRLGALVDSLQAVHDLYAEPVVVSLHPRTRNRLGELPELVGLEFHRPFSFSDYCRLQIDARCVLSDSGTITEEAALLGFPAVTLRDSIERPEGLDTGNIIMCGLERADVLAAVATAIGSRPATVPVDYTVSDTSERVLRLLVGLTSRSASWAGLHR